MYALLGVLVVLFIVLLCIRIVWKYIETRRLFMMFGIENNQESFSQINKEYYKKIKDPEFNEQTLYDLEINKVFDKINRTYSDVGREYLYGRFFKQTHDSLFEEVIKRLNHKDILKKVIYNLYNLSKHYNESLALFQYVDFLSKPELIFIIGMGFVPIILILLFFVGSGFALSLLFMWIGLQSLIYTHYAKKTNNVLKQAFSYCHIVYTLNQFVKEGVFDQDVSQKLKTMIHKSYKYTHIYRICMKIEKIDVFYFMELVYALFPLTFIQCYILYKHKDKLEEDYIKMYEYVGLVDLAVSTLSLRTEYQYCIPQVSTKEEVMFQNIYHPILKEPVKNTMQLSQSCMITGSNASGKSTFIKTVGFNMVMAKTIHTCFADSFTYHPYTICTSIHMKDEIGDGDSYYVKEIKVLKGIIDKVKEGKCLVLIDEILKGTNEKERLMIARAVLNFLFHQQSLVIITTHDVSLVEHFQDIHQYSFHDSVEDGKLECDYLIKKGVCYVGNAIKLLEVYGFDQVILDELHDKSL